MSLKVKLSARVLPTHAHTNKQERARRQKEFWNRGISKTWDLLLWQHQHAISKELQLGLSS